MKQIIPSENKARTISNIIVVAAGIGMLAVMYYFQPIWATVQKIAGVVTPFVVGGALAFLQLPVIKKVEWFFSKTIFKKKAHPKASRAMATAISLIFLLAVVAAVMLLVVYGG